MDGGGEVDMRRKLVSLFRIIVLVVIPCVSQTIFASDVFNGKEVFMRHCVACHGSSGEGSMPGLPNFKEGKTLFKNDSELMAIIRDGRGIMPSFNGLIKDDDIRDVAAYLRTFL